MYRCEDCGHLFEEGEQARWEESRGEHFGTPCSETMSGCPICKGDYEEVEPCKLCDSYEKVENGYCEECRKHYTKDFKQLLDERYDEKEREFINILFEGEEL